MEIANQHEAIVFTTEGDQTTIAVPVTSVQSSTSHQNQRQFDIATSEFESYQVIVMPEEPAQIEVKAQFPTKIEPSQIGQYHSGNLLLNSFAKKSAAKRETKKKLQCSLCPYTCWAPVLMANHCSVNHSSACDVFAFKFCSHCGAKFMSR